MEVEEVETEELDQTDFIQRFMERMFDSAASHHWTQFVPADLSYYLEELQGYEARTRNAIAVVLDMRKRGLRTGQALRPLQKQLKRLINTKKVLAARKAVLLSLGYSENDEPDEDARPVKMPWETAMKEALRFVIDEVEAAVISHMRLVF